MRIISRQLVQQEHRFNLHFPCSILWGFVFSAVFLHRRGSEHCWGTTGIITYVHSASGNRHPSVSSVECCSWSWRKLPRRPNSNTNILGSSLWGWGVRCWFEQCFQSWVIVLYIKREIVYPSQQKSNQWTHLVSMVQHLRKEISPLLIVAWPLPLLYFERIFPSNFFLFLRVSHWTRSVVVVDVLLMLHLLHFSVIVGILILESIFRVLLDGFVVFFRLQRNDVKICILLVVDIFLRIP